MQRLGKISALFVLAAAVALTTGCAVQTEPLAKFTVTPERGFPPLDVTFDASESSSPNGPIVDYAWKFGDGATAAGSNVSHTYADKGDYIVALEVRDSAGQRGELSRVVEVLNHAPVARFTTSLSSVTAHEPVQFDASESYDPDGEVVEYSWDFGDGTTDTGLRVEHAYGTADGGGWHPVITLAVTDDNGDVDVVKRTLQVNGCCGH